MNIAIRNLLILAFLVAGPTVNAESKDHSAHHTNSLQTPPSAAKNHPGGHENMMKKHKDMMHRSHEKPNNCACSCDAHKEDHATHKGVAADVALSWILNGNERFQNGKLRNDGISQKDREKLVPAQSPHTIVLSCSDSRVPPEVVFDQKLGEIFVVRTAGETLDNMAIASIEYAVEHLGPQLLVVLGHEACGAVKAAFNTLENQEAGSPALNALVKDIHPRIKKFSGSKPSNAFISESMANAAGVARDLVGRSEIIAKKVESQNLKIQTAIYHLNSGWVEFFNEAQENTLAEQKDKKTESRAPASEGTPAVEHAPEKEDAHSHHH